VEVETAPDYRELIPLFPLPNCVLLPRAVLPLHIFEPRYREMVSDCLAGRPFIAMALLLPGYEEKYYTSAAKIHPVVCTGRIVRHEELNDGRYNILLQGIVRAEVLDEDRTRIYRRALLRPLPPTGAATAASEEAIRRRLAAALGEPALRAIADECAWRQLVDARELPVTDIVDYLASAVSRDVACARKFLEQIDLERRAEMLLNELKDFARRLAAAAECSTARPWPRRTVTN
jgi:Lon protease-like protein